MVITMVILMDRGYKQYIENDGGYKQWLYIENDGGYKQWLCLTKTVLFVDTANRIMKWCSMEEDR